MRCTSRREEVEVFPLLPRRQPSRPTRLCASQEVLGCREAPDAKDGGRSGRERQQQCHAVRDCSKINSCVPRGGWAKLWAAMQVSCTPLGAHHLVTPMPPPPQPPATPISDSDDVDDFYLFLLKQQPATAIYWVHFPGMEKALLITTRVVCTKMRLYVMGFVVFFASKNCQ